jgi:diguanylate cyclase
VTASFSVARLRPDETAADLLQRVDQRLYEAKRKGRNCVAAESADEDSPSETRPQRRVANG